MSGKPATRIWHLLRFDASMPRWCSRDEDGRFFDLRGVSDDRYSAGTVMLSLAAGHPNDLVADPRAIAVERPLAARHLLKPDSETGWVDPKGRFWGCDFHAHDWLAHALLRTFPFDLEQLNWARVHAASFAVERRRDMADRQVRTLFDLGFADPTARFSGRLPEERRGEAGRVRRFAVTAERFRPLPDAEISWTPRPTRSP